MKYFFSHLDLANADAVHRDAEVVKYLEEEEEKEVQFYMIFGDLSISYSDWLFRSREPSKEEIVLPLVICKYIFFFKEKKTYPTCFWDEMFLVEKLRSIEDCHQCTKLTNWQAINLKSSLLINSPMTIKTDFILSIYLFSSLWQVEISTFKPKLCGSCIMMLSCMSWT